ncbi:MAG: hypothetical protein H6868_05045 [Rhodospirillales bacterium]|nr:hypothetical protein [Rhodospirillales bacterium]
MILNAQYIADMALRRTQDPAAKTEFFLALSGDLVLQGIFKQQTQKPDLSTPAFSEAFEDTIDYLEYLPDKDWSSTRPQDVENALERILTDIGYYKTIFHDEEQNRTGSVDLQNLETAFNAAARPALKATAEAYLPAPDDAARQQWFMDYIDTLAQDIERNGATNAIAHASTWYEHLDSPAAQELKATMKQAHAIILSPTPRPPAGPA